MEIKATDFARAMGIEVIEVDLTDNEQEQDNEGSV